MTATVCTAEDTHSESGFLTDYSQLSQDDPLKSADWLYINKNVVSCQVSIVIASEAKQSLATGSQVGVIQEIATAFGLANDESMCVIANLTGQ
jgi:hypothetical protein